MKKTFFTFISIAACACVYAGQIYISSSEGDDKNDGSQNAPLRTIAAAPKEGNDIFLKRGDTFFEYISGFKKTNFDAYGKGAKPVLSGFKILKNPDAWVRLPNNLWRLDLSVAADFEGFPAKLKQNNIGAIYYPDSDKIYGHLVRRFNNMNNFGDFWVSSNVNRGEVQEKAESFKHLYFRMKKNPSHGGVKVCFSHNGTGVRGNYDCVFKNIKITGFGVHGVAGAYGCKFQNLELDIIGGSVQLGYPRWARLGNGFEFWVSSAEKSGNDNTVEECIVSRTFDCGSTIQGFAAKNGEGIIRNVKFSRNLFIHCRQAFEHFIGARKADDKNNVNLLYDNCEFSNNLCIDNGDNMFSSPETRDAHLLSYDSLPVNGLKIKNNVFWGGNFYCAQSKTAKLENNIVFVFRDSYFFYDRNNSERLVFASDENSESKARAVLDDKSDKFFIVDRFDSAARKKAIDKYFSAYKDVISKFDRK